MRVPDQQTINLIYAMEEIAEELGKHLGDTDDELRRRVYDCKSGLNDLMEDLEDNIMPEDHPNFSVVALDKARYWEAGQSHHMERHYEHKNRKFRVRICRNAYAEQSWAHITSLDTATLKWNVVASIPFSHWPAKAQAISYVVPLTVVQQGYLINIANELCSQVRMLMYTADDA